jgi:hypothetical protein
LGWVDTIDASIREHTVNANKSNGSDVVTPFDWQRYTAGRATAAGPTDKRSGSRDTRKRAVPASELAARVLAHRWGNPYSKPGRVDFSD